MANQSLYYMHNAKVIPPLQWNIDYSVIHSPTSQLFISHKYTPDFILPNGIIVETKGLFDPDDRKKHELIRKQHPLLDIRLVFSRSASPIRKGSKTTYGSWCAKMGIQYADKVIPQAWINEPTDPKRHAAIGAALIHLRLLRLPT